MKSWLPILLVSLAPAGHAEMWKCVDQDGNTRYTNVRNEAKGCQALNLGPINTAPPPVAAPATKPQVKPANFPTVSSDTQKQRDADRRRILEQELVQEQQQLEIAKKHLSEQQEIRLGSEKNPVRMQERLKPYEEKVRLHATNIESLKKEIANVR